MAGFIIAAVWVGGILFGLALARARADADQAFEEMCRGLRQ